MVPSKAKRNPVSGDHQVCFAWTTAAFAFTLLFASSCGGPLFHVKPVAALPPLPATVASANLGRSPSGGANANRRRESGTI